MELKEPGGTLINILTTIISIENRAVEWMNLQDESRTLRANPLDLPVVESNPIGLVSISLNLVSDLPVNRVLLLFLAEVEPEELELEVSAPLAIEPRVLKGEIGEARSSLQKSSLFSLQLSESWNRVVKESKLEISCMGFAECDMSCNQFAKKYL
nr:hypothetical protein CFP56_30436 [Quercus suber]